MRSVRLGVRTQGFYLETGVRILHRLLLFWALLEKYRIPPAVTEVDDCNIADVSFYSNKYNL